MQITQATLASIFTAFETIFNAAFQGVQSAYKRFTMEGTSTTRENNYSWMAKIPRMREWVGERVIQNLSARDYTVKNKDFELTLEVDRNDIEDDQLGIFTPMLQMMGQQVASNPGDIVIDLMKAGETQTGFDGQYFFDTDHPVNLDDPAAGVQSNLFTATALTHDNYGTVRAAMMSLVGEDGRPLGVTPNLLIVPPQLETTAKKILNAEKIDGGDTNVHKDTAEIMVMPELADRPTEWYLIDASKPIKPFIYQNRKAPVFTYLTQPTAENVFMHKKYIYGADSRGNAGYTLWFLAAKAKA